jgi:hypothetical protein
VDVTTSAPASLNQGQESEYTLTVRTERSSITPQFRNNKYPYEVFLPIGETRRIEVPGLGAARPFIDIIILRITANVETQGDISLEPLQFTWPSESPEIQTQTAIIKAGSPIFDSTAKISAKFTATIKVTEGAIISGSPKELETKQVTLFGNPICTDTISIPGSISLWQLVVAIIAIIVAIVIAGSRRFP